MSRRLYVYYRVPAAALAETVEAVRAMQSALQTAWPDLETGLLRRPRHPDGTADEDVTLMETYTRAGGVGPAWQAAIEAAAADLPGPAGRAERHVEVFETLD